MGGDIFWGKFLIFLRGDIFGAVFDIFDLGNLLGQLIIFLIERIFFRVVFNILERGYFLGEVLPFGPASLRTLVQGKEGLAAPDNYDE